MRERMHGVTLLELLIAVAIVGILGSIAYPSYVQYVVRTNRTAAKTVLLQIADRQEQYFADNKQYAADLVDLGYPSASFMIDDQGVAVGDAAADRLYQITLTGTSATTFTANAEPQARQAGRDAQCQTLTLTHTGLRGQTGGGTNCW